MYKKIIAIMLSCISLCTMLASCSKEEKAMFGDFYPYDLTKYVDLGNYTGLDISFAESALTGFDVEKEILAELKKFKQTKEKEVNRPVKNGDVVNIDFKGFIKGKAFEGGEGKNYPLEIGSNSFIAGFESGIIGKKVGDKFNLELKFPANYHEKKFADKPVTFEVKLNKVLEIEYPQLTDEIVSKISQFSTVKEYKDNLTERLTVEKEAAIEKENYNNLVSNVIDCCKIKKYPKAEIKKYTDNYRESYKNVAAQYGLSLEEYITRTGTTQKDFDEKIEADAKKMIEKEMIFLLISIEEEVKLTDFEFDKTVDKYMKDSNFSGGREEFIKQIGEDDLRGYIIIDKTIKQVMEKYRG